MGTTMINSRWENLRNLSGSDLLSASLSVKTTKTFNLVSRIWICLFEGGFDKNLLARNIHSFLANPAVQNFFAGRDTEELSQVMRNIAALKVRFSHGIGTKVEGSCRSLEESIQLIDRLREGKIRDGVSDSSTTITERSVSTASSPRGSIPDEELEVPFVISPTVWGAEREEAERNAVEIESDLAAYRPSIRDYVKSQIESELGGSRLFKPTDVRKFANLQILHELKGRFPKEAVNEAIDKYCARVGITREVFTSVFEEGLKRLDDNIEQQLVLACRAHELNFGRNLTQLMDFSNMYGEEGRIFLKQALLIALPQIFELPENQGQKIYLNLYKKFCDSRLKSGWDNEAKEIVSHSRFRFERPLISPVHVRRLSHFSTKLVREFQEIAQESKRVVKEWGVEIKRLQGMQETLGSQMVAINTEIRRLSSAIHSRNLSIERGEVSDPSIVMGQIIELNESLEQEKGKLAECDRAYTQFQGQKDRLSKAILNPSAVFKAAKAVKIVSMPLVINMCCYFPS